jgi:hypothetical protein
MKRRTFIALAGGAAAMWPLAARAQKTMPVIGFLSPGSPGAGGPLLAAFRQGLNETGRTEGQNFTIQYQWVEQNDRLPALAADLAGRKLDLIVAISDPMALAAKNASSTIPVVLHRRRPRRQWPRRQSGSTGRQPDRRYAVRRRTESKTTGAIVRVGSASEGDRVPRESEQPACRGIRRIRPHAASGAREGGAAPHCEGVF